VSLFGRVERAGKRAWHHDVVADPETHAWVLNLYRAGEHHPDTVDDYFPWRAAEDAWPELSRQLRRHAADERGHTGLYTKAIEAIGGEVLELEGLDVFNHAIRAETAIAWALGPEDPLPLRRLALAHFLAHAHQLERRVASSLTLHLEACRAAPEREGVAEVVARVLVDEQRHVASTAQALTELTTAGERSRILAFHADAEARADKAFSARQVRFFLRRFADRASPSHRLFYALGARTMEWMHG
jgi:hypothetical protein